MSVAAASLRSRTFSALRFYNYRLYFGAQILSFSGTWMQSVALSWLVLELTGSGTALGTVVAMQFVPTLLLAPVGGVVADRLEKRKLIMITQSAAALQALALGLLTVSGSVRLWMVYLLAAGFGTVTAFDNPSRQIFIMEMVPAEHVSNAVTLNAVVVNAARIIGPAIGGVMIATVGTGQCFIFNAVSYGAVIAALALLRQDELTPTERSARRKGQLREGLGYAWRHPGLRMTLGMLLIMGIFTYEFNVSLPVLAEFSFDSGATGLALLTSFMGAGAVVGGLLTASIGDPTPERLTAAAGLLGVTVLAISVMPTLLLACVIMPFMGAASVAVISMSNAMLQLTSTPALRGRVMSLYSMAMMGSTPIGGPIVGALAEHVSPRAGLAAGGVAAFVAFGIGWRSRRAVQAVPAA